MIHIPYPNARDRAKILRGYLDGASHTVSDADLDALAIVALGLTGADIEQITRTARRHARRDKGRPIETEDLRRLILGIPSHNMRHPIGAPLLKRICVHETGHTLVTLLGADGGQSLQHVSASGPSEHMGGFVLSQPNISLAMSTGEYILDQICAVLAGRAAEAMIFGENSIGIGSGGADPACDLARATRLACAYVSHYGFSKSGVLLWRQQVPEQNSPLAEEIEQLLQDQYDRAGSLLASHRMTFDKIVEQLMVRQDLSGDEVRRIARDTGLRVADQSDSPALEEAGFVGAY